MNRRDAITTSAAFGLSLAVASALPVATAFAQSAASAVPTTPEEALAISPEDMVLGDPDAPVTVIAFESLTCSHCASFHGDAFPELKKQYIDTGKVKFVFRDFPFDGAALRAAMLVRCADPDRRFGFLEVLFRSQASWAHAPDPVAALRKVARMGGIGEARFNQCLQDETVMNGVLQRRLVGAQLLDVQSTPTFLIDGNDERIVGAQPFEAFDKVLKPLTN